MLVNSLPALSQTALIEAINVSMPGNFLEKLIFFRHVEEEIHESSVKLDTDLTQPKNLAHKVLRWQKLKVLSLSH